MNSYEKFKFIMAKQEISLYLVLSLAALVPNSHGSNSNYKSNQVPFFIFGDSFLDAGNNNYINTTTLDQANFWPYGETYFDFPTGRFSDGRLVSDFIAEYANLSLIRPFLLPGNNEYYEGVNFASGGAGALLETFQGSVIPLKTQAVKFRKVASWFRHKLGKSESKRKLSKAVYLFSIGANDYLSQFLTDSQLLNSYSHLQYVGMVIGNLTTVIKEIHKLGGRKFVFMNLPPLGCLPGARIIQSQGNGSCLKELSSLANLHNKAFSMLLFQLRRQLKGFKYSLYDFNSDFTQRMNHPSKYGFKEGKVACCGTGSFRGVYSCGGKRMEREFELCESPSDHLFWDSYHLTESAYKQFAAQMWSHTSNSNIAMSYTMRDLFQLP